MGDYISDLTDDILCHILPFLTAKDACRVRSLSYRFKDLPECRSALRFDSSTIFGEVISSSQFQAYGSKFVKAIDHVVKNLGAHKIRSLKIKYRLRNEYASHINGWIARFGNEVEELDLDFLYRWMDKSELYALPFRLLHTKDGSNLKRLRLKCCELTLVRRACTTWLCNLTTIELSQVHLRWTDMECILLGNSNLESLSLIECRFCHDYIICLQHPSLKKLVFIEAHLAHFKLNCPFLETFHFSGHARFTFSHAPLMREASLKLSHGSSVSIDLAESAPQLQTLCYWVTTKVPPHPPRATMSCLKRLELGIKVPTSIDLSTITNMLHASPVLEALYIKVNEVLPKTYHILPTRYADCPHFHLKEVKIEVDYFYGDYYKYVVELVEYLLRNVVSLQQMVFVMKSDEASSKFRNKPKFTEWQNINPDAELIVVSSVNST